jgi:glycosyltransferase involved in cell wall biosynthesis
VGADAAVETIYRCILALHEAGVDSHADIILLDDGAQGGSATLLPAVVRNLRYLHQPAGGSRAAARNALAASARSGLVAFLAPHLQVQRGWLAELADTFAREPEAALVAAKVVRDDGLVHATGMLLGDDGKLRDPGRLAEADDPSHDFMRAVDAVGDVAFAVRRDALDEAGGFSPAFAGQPQAVFDLCMRLRMRGKQVLVQPLAVAVWSDDGLAETSPVLDLGLSDEDARRLRQRWPQVAGRPTGSPRPARFLGHALVVDTDLPRPDRDAGSVVTVEQMLLLRRLDYRVTFAATGEVAPEGNYADALRRRGIEVVGASRHASITAYLEAEGARLDLVHIYRHTNATLLLDRVRELAPKARVVFSPVDLHFLREAREAELNGRASLGAPETRALELDCIRGSDATLLHSDYELDLVGREVDPAKLRLLRWIAHPQPSSRGFDGRRGICFVGGFRHGPNVDAVTWFAAEVLPRVLRTIPDLCLQIVGSDAPDQVRALASPNIEILGWVDDLGRLFEGVRLSVAPLRYGAGFKGKVATSLAHGVPVVGSPIALEGMGLAPGDGIVVADSAAAFADAVVTLHEDASAWTELAARALDRCAALYAPAAAQDVYRGLLGDLGVTPPS